MVISVCFFVFTSWLCRYLSRKFWCDPHVNMVMWIMRGTFFQVITIINKIYMYTYILFL